MNDEQITITEPENEKVYLTFSIDTLNDVTKWGKFIAVITILSGALGCLSILGIPIAIFAIIAGLKLFNTCSDMKAYMMTGNRSFGDSAGENLYKYYKNLMIMEIVAISLVILLIIAMCILLPIIIKAIWETPEFQEFWTKFEEEFAARYPDMPIPTFSPY